MPKYSSFLHQVFVLGIFQMLIDKQVTWDRKHLLILLSATFLRILLRGKIEQKCVYFLLIFLFFLSELKDKLSKL